MRVAVMGTGYVGLVTGADFATRGHEVTCVDIDAGRIEGLQRGVMPFFESGLAELVASAGDHLEFSTDGAAAMRDADVVLSAVGTPLGEDGHADLRAVFAVAEMFASHAKDGAVLVNKSTVPVGTAAVCAERIRQLDPSTPRPLDHFAVVSNPEFLSQGTAVADTAHPTRIVIGTTNDAARAVLRELYASFIAEGIPYLEMAPASAEAVKCAANAFLATKISFTNEIANYCAKVGGNVTDVAAAIGLDPRIGPHFLRAGLGYGGGCLSKDVRSLIAAGNDAGTAFRLLPAVEAVNDEQRTLLYRKAKETLGDLAGKRIAVWGLAFKPGTDDVRSAPAIEVIAKLLADDADVVAYDPAAMQRAAVVFPNIEYANSALAAARNADALMLFTEWPEFFAIDIAQLVDVMQQAIILDGRGVFANQNRPANVRYSGIGCG